MEDGVSTKEAIDVKKGRKKKNPTSTDGKNGGGANVEKAFGV